MIFKVILLMLLSVSCVYAQQSSCSVTPHRTTGTHYKAVTEHRQDISKGLVVSGTVMSYPDCVTVANARVAHWQAGEDGRYQDRLRAYLYTDVDGQFRFETEWPRLKPPHIHFIVSAPGMQTIETQWVGAERVKNIVFNIVLRQNISE